MKRCKRCGQSKPLKDFPLDRRYSKHERRRVICMDCSADHSGADLEEKKPHPLAPSPLAERGEKNPTPNPSPQARRGKKPHPPEGKKVGVKWQEDAEILFRLDQVATLMLEGAKPYQIAESMGYSWDTARRDMERVNLLWRERVGGSIEGKRAEAIAQYRHIAMHAWAQYRKVSARTDMVIGQQNGGGGVKTTGYGKEKAVWLKMAIDAQKEIDAILGTHAPKEITVGIHLSEAAIGALDVLERQGVQREALYAEFESFIIEEAARLAEDSRR